MNDSGGRLRGRVTCVPTTCHFAAGAVLYAAGLRIELHPNRTRTVDRQCNLAMPFTLRGQLSSLKSSNT